MEVKEHDLVCLRMETKFGYSNTWWRVMFIDNDQTFAGKLERCHWNDYTEHKEEAAKFSLKENETGYIIIKGDEVNSFLAAIMRHLDSEQMICLRDKIIRRTPKLDYNP